jgi:hypothetical protein
MINLPLDLAIPALVGAIPPPGKREQTINGTAAKPSIIS